MAWKPRRHGLGGVSDGAAVDDGGVGLLARATERPCRLNAVPEVWLGVSGKPLGRGRLKPLRLHARYDRPAAHRHTHAVQASLAPLYPPYATGSNHHTCLSRSAA